MDFPFVPVDGFTPNAGGWSSVGQIDSWSTDTSGQHFTFQFGSRSFIISILGPQAFRLRFNPAIGASYDWESSVAVQTRDLGLNGLNIQATKPTPTTLQIDTGQMRLVIALDAFRLAVYRGEQLIHCDFEENGILYIPGSDVVATIKTAAPGAGYVGCGEKAGAGLLKNGFTFTFFNFDNFSYATGPALGDNGPLNPTIPLYCSIPVLIESNPFPQGEFAGPAYSYGVFLDNPAQSFINVEANDYSDMSGRYYLGALYNELDYYFMAGTGVGDVVEQYTALTGRSPMPPRYAFGLHQGAYGYYDRFKLALAANAYRAARIPCDGLHIDVDFQDNYRTFTHSERKFPDAAHLFEDLHSIGFKLSTNITPILTDNPLDENGAIQPYTQRSNLETANALLSDSRAGGTTTVDLYEGGVNYGNNRGSNPYPYPPLKFNRDGLMPLSARGNYPDFGLASVRKVWGEQYEHLISDLGLDMIWQDMTCPAIDSNLPPDIEEYKTFAQDLLLSQEVTLANGTVQVEQRPNAQVHNSYVLNLLKATANGVDTLRSGQRNFIIARGGYAGMQRYAGLWTGDSASSWDFLRINIPEVLNLGLSGVPIGGCDIGGFAVGTGTVGSSQIVGGTVTGGITNYELLTRWMQVGSFLPWFRNHYDGYNKQYQEPYAYPEPVPTNCRKYVELRYRMLQVYYDAMYRWTQTGMPIVRPLFLNDAGDQGVYQHLDDQFFLGDDFLVAPILNPHETATPPSAPTRSVYLPAGSDWYAFTDNRAPLTGQVAGGTLIPNYYAALDSVPTYVRAGAILPFSELEQWVGQLTANPLTLNCYPGPDRWTDDLAYQLYQDDGISTDAQVGKYRVSRVYQRTRSNDGRVTRQVRVTRVKDGFTPPQKFYYIALLASVSKPMQLLLDAMPLPDVETPDMLASSPANSWYWNESIQVTFVKVFDTLPDTTVTVNY